MSTFVAGSHVGPYEIIAPIGAGGMGEVFKARDTRLERLVAIKTSNEKFSERFQREAHAIASLNHPHICTLYDVGPDYLVLELIEGQPIKGPLPVAETLKLATQIAEALSEAHRRGVIHRDLKPANILVTKAGVKILDFGLAKLGAAHSGAQQSGSVASALTQKMLTQEGIILGTPQYMSPEQIEGKEADARTDIFGFGLVLYELLAGQPAFNGKTQTSMVASILAAEPVSISSFQPLVPPALEHLIRTCLAKDPDERRQNMHDVLLELRWIAASGSQAGMPKPVVQRRKHREWLAWALAGAAAAAAAVLGIARLGETPSPRPAVRFQFMLPEKVRMDQFDRPTISPDGRSIVVAARGTDGVRRIWLRRLDSFAITTLPGTEDAGSIMAWSPDSRSIVFRGGGKLRRLDIAGGSPVELADIGQNANTYPTWFEDGTIVFNREGALYRVSASGGKAERALPAELSVQGEGMPEALPGGGRMIYGTNDPNAANIGTFFADLQQKKAVRLFRTRENAQFARPGYLVFGRQQSLVAQRFDWKSGQLLGEPATIAADVNQSGFFTGYTAFSVSQADAAAYRTAGGVSSLTNFTYYERSGLRLGTIGPSKNYSQFQVAPDGRRLSVMTSAEAGGKAAVWEMSLSSGILTLLAPPAARTDNAVWSPDSREIIYPSADSGPVQMYRKAAGSEQQTLLFPSKVALYAEQWLSDNSLIYLDTSGKNFYRLRLVPGAQPEPLLQTAYEKDEPDVSTDGRWIVYQANQTGRWEIYVAAFPSFDRRRQISSNGGVQPKWSKDGKEIFYLSLDGSMMSVPVASPATLDTGAPKALFRPNIVVYPTRDQYAVLDNGRKFLVLESPDSAQEPIHVVVNWQSLIPSGGAK